ncbi:MAG: hypothetical protein IJ358_01815 [Clostridia bacterium]|nr:hypothetical protein [Clostridia bacterium]
MSEDRFGDDDNNSSDGTEKITIPVWELLFDNKKEKECFMILDNLLNKKVKVWSVLADTVNGVRGTWKGQVGVLTSLDDEFIVLDNTIILSRKFIYRIENV